MGSKVNNLKTVSSYWFSHYFTVLCLSTAPSFLSSPTLSPFPLCNWRSGKDILCNVKLFQSFAWNFLWFLLVSSFLLTNHRSSISCIQNRGCGSSIRLTTGCYLHTFCICADMYLCWHVKVIAILMTRLLGNKLWKTNSNSKINGSPIIFK